MGTLIEEIFSRKTGKSVQTGDILLMDVDFIMSHDNTTPLAIKAFREIGKPIFDKNRIVLHLDHAYPAPNILAAENHKMIIDFVKEQGLPHHTWCNYHRRGLTLEHIRRVGRIWHRIGINRNRCGLGDG
jgi:3-isopropylmalate/(R)-2-methylmalate dehydratase large subunit